MDAMDAVPHVGRSIPGVRTRAVIALVRPLAPNPAVLSAAATFASEHGATLLVLGTLEPRLSDWVDGVDLCGPVISAAHGELFATCVEQLWDRDVAWGVDVLWGRLAPQVAALAERVEVVSVVRGCRSPETVLRRVRRRITGRLDDLVTDVEVRAV